MSFFALTNPILGQKCHFRPSSGAVMSFSTFPKPVLGQKCQSRPSQAGSSSVQFIYFTHSQNIQINLLLQSTAPVTKYNKELQITIKIHFDCKRDKD